MRPAVCFIGWSGSGKTTLLCQLLPVLRAQGIRAAVIKHSSHPHPLHPEGSDTQKLERAGARAVALATPEGVSATWRGAPEKLIPPLLSQLDAELVLIEGWKEGPYPKIEVFRPGLGEPLAGRIQVQAVVADQELPGVSVRRFASSQLQELAAFVLQLATLRVAGNVT